MKKTDRALLIFLIIVIILTLSIIIASYFYRQNKYIVNAELSEIGMPHASLFLFRTGLSDTRDDEAKGIYIINNQGDLKLRFRNHQDNSYEYLDHEKLLISGNLIDNKEMDTDNNLFYINNDKVISIQTAEDKILRDLSLSPEQKYLKYETYNNGDLEKMCISNFDYKEAGECDDIYANFKDEWNWKEYILLGEWLEHEDVFAITINHYKDSLNETEEIIIKNGFDSNTRDVHLRKYKPTKIYYYYPQNKELKEMPADTDITYKSKYAFIADQEYGKNSFYNNKDMFSKKDDYRNLNNGEYSILYRKENRQYILKKGNNKAELITLDEYEAQGVDVVWFNKVTLNPFDYE